jgi:hypothetical protein
MNNLYEDGEGVIRQSVTDNHFSIRVYRDCAEVVFVVGRTEAVVGTFNTVAEADAAYDSIIDNAVTVNDAIAMIRERA